MTTTARSPQPQARPFNWTHFHMAKAMPTLYPWMAPPKPKTFIGVDLAAPGADRTAIVVYHMVPPARPKRGRIRRALAWIGAAAILAGVIAGVTP